jgi:hypothetical protein
MLFNKTIADERDNLHNYEMQYNSNKLTNQMQQPL